jgi:hypothetical protein
MARFVADEFRQVYYHDNHDREDCDMCMARREVIRIGTGYMLRILLLKNERFTAGSNAAAIRCGGMNLSDSIALMSDQSLQTPGRRLETVLAEDFPGLDMLEHIGSDLPLHSDNYIGLLRHGDQMYKTLRVLYAGRGDGVIYTRGDSLPHIVTTAFLTICAHISGLLTLSASSTWSLWSHVIYSDSILLGLRRYGR